MPSPPQLEDQVLAALEQALREERPDVAEHLMCALEALCGDAMPGLALADAYLLAARGPTPGKPPN